MGVKLLSLSITKAPGKDPDLKDKETHVGLLSVLFSFIQLIMFDILVAVCEIEVSKQRKEQASALSSAVHQGSHIVTGPRHTSNRSNQHLDTLALLGNSLVDDVKCITKNANQSMKVILGDNGKVHLDKDNDGVFLENVLLNSSIVMKSCSIMSIDGEYNSNIPFPHKSRKSRMHVVTCIKS